MKRYIKEQPEPQSIKAGDFVSKLQNELGFKVYGDDVAELVIKGEGIRNTMKREGLYIGIGIYEENGMEGLFPIKIGVRFAKSSSKWKSLFEEMKNEMYQKVDSTGDKFQIRNRAINPKIEEIHISFDDAIIPSTQFFEFLKKYVGKFISLAETVNETDLRKIIKRVLSESDDSYSEECFNEEAEILGDFLGIDVKEEDLGPEMSKEEILSMVDDENKSAMSEFMDNVSNMGLGELKRTLNDLLSVEKLKEQNTPYFQQTVRIGMGDYPRILVDGTKVIMILFVITTIMDLLFAVGKNFSGKNRRRRLQSKAVGCQGGNARAKLVRQRRRRENWKRLLRKLGLK